MSCILAFLFLPVLCHLFSTFQGLLGQSWPFTHFISCSHVPLGSLLPHPLPAVIRVTHLLPLPGFQELRKKSVMSVTPVQNLPLSWAGLSALPCGPSAWSPWSFCSSTSPVLPTQPLWLCLLADALRPHEGGEEWCSSSFFPSTLQILFMQSRSPPASSFQGPCWNISLFASPLHWLFLSSQSLTPPSGFISLSCELKCSLLLTFLKKEFLSHKCEDLWLSCYLSLPFHLQTSAGVVHACHFHNILPFHSLASWIWPLISSFHWRLFPWHPSDSLAASPGSFFSLASLTRPSSIFDGANPSDPGKPFPPLPGSQILYVCLEFLATLIIPCASAAPDMDIHVCLCFFLGISFIVAFFWKIWTCLLLDMFTQIIPAT